MYLIILIILILGVFVVIGFNGLTSSRQKVNESWADIDVQLKRRQDLIPNLIDTVKGYASHEETIFEHIADIRTKAIALPLNDIEKKSEVEKDLENSTHQLLAIAESYPDLKASENFQKLQQDLVNTEDEIASARRIYNDNAANYNIKTSVFPTNLISVLCSLKPVNFFQNQ
jgi:LemA protein